jgi:hypothetical protein
MTSDESSAQRTESSRRMDTGKDDGIGWSDDPVSDRARQWLARQAAATRYDEWSYASPAKRFVSPWQIAAALIVVAGSAPGHVTAQLVDQYGGKRTALPQMAGEYSQPGRLGSAPTPYTGV